MSAFEAVGMVLGPQGHCILVPEAACGVQSMWCPVQDANPEQAWKHRSPSRSRVRRAREW